MDRVLLCEPKTPADKALRLRPDSGAEVMVHIVLWFSCHHVFQKLAGEWGTVFRRHLQHDQVAVPSVQVLPREAGIAWPFCQLVNSLFMAGPALRRRVRISLNESAL